MDNAGITKEIFTKQLTPPSINLFTGGTNKSHFIIDALCGETVRVGRLNNFKVDYLRTGHSKTDADRLFANIATALQSKDYFNHLYVQFPYTSKSNKISQYVTRHHW